MVDPRDGGVRPSLLDRLIADEDDQTGGGIHDIRVDVGTYKESVLRDLEWLLNTREFLSVELDPASEAFRSVLTYGLPDLSLFSPRSLNDQEQISALIKAALIRHEPRFNPDTIEVERVSFSQDHRMVAQFRVRAELSVNPMSDDEREVVFDTTVDFDNSKIKLEEGE